MKRTWPFVLLILLFSAIVLRTVPAPLHPPPQPWPKTDGPFLTTTAPEAPIAVEPGPPPVQTPVEPPQSAPVARSSVAQAHSWLTRMQNPDGSWGDGSVTLGGRPIGRIGVTSLAVLSLFGAGYSHLSKDGPDEGKPLGPMIGKALEWLLAQKAEDGFDQALATYAINEAYGMTGSQRFRVPAADSLDALLRMQGSDGSWGAPEPTAWAARAIFAAQLNEYEIPQQARESLLQYIQSTSHPANVGNRIHLTRDNTLMAADAVLLAQTPPSGEGRDFSDWYNASLSVFQFDGPDGPGWKSWAEPMKNAILPLQQGDGSWRGGSVSHQVVRASLALQTLQVYYRYANVFAANR